MAYQEASTDYTISFENATGTAPSIASSASIGATYNGLVHYLVLPDSDSKNQAWAIEACTLASLDKLGSNSGYNLVTTAGDIKMNAGLANASTAMSASAKIDANEVNNSADGYYPISFASTYSEGTSTAPIKGTFITPFSFAAFGSNADTHYAAGIIVNNGKTLTLPAAKGTLALTSDIPSSAKSLSTASSWLTDLASTTAASFNGTQTAPRPGVTGVLGLGNGGLGVDASSDSGKATARTNLSVYSKSEVDSKITNTVTSAVDFLGTANSTSTVQSLAAGKAQSGDMIRATGAGTSGTSTWSIPAGTTNTSAQTVHPGDMLLYIGSGTATSDTAVTSDNWQVVHTEVNTNTWTAASQTAAGYVPATGTTANKTLVSNSSGGPTWKTPAVTLTKTGKTVSSSGSYTPAGSVSIAAKTTTIQHITGVGTLPSFSASYDSSVKSLTLAFSQGTLPTMGSVTVGSGAAQTATLTGTAATISVSGTVSTADSASVSYS